MTEVPGNVRLIGGEMLLWSDADAVTDWRGAGLELVRRLVPPGGRVLVAGPHPKGLIGAVSGTASSVAVLVRSYPDACALGERHPALDVHCGRLRALTGVQPYDLVLALDGLERTHSAEEPAPPWRASLQALAALVAPGGRLVLAVPNDLGVDRFVDARPPDREGADGHWEPHGFDPSHPGGPEALDAALEAVGVVAERCYAAYPSRCAPRALFGRELLREDLPEALTVPLTAPGGDTMLVADPLRLTRLAFRHGLGEHLAPLWLTVATRPRSSAAEDGPHGAEAEEGSYEPGVAAAEEGPYEAGAGIDEAPYAPGVAPAEEPGVASAEEGPYASDVVAEHACAPDVAVEDAREPAAVADAPRDVLPEGLVEVGRAVHEVTATSTRRLPGGTARPIPRGRIVEEVLVEACAREDVRAVRDLLAALAAWVADGGDAPADNLVWDGERFTAITPVPAPGSPESVPVVLCRILWRFAVRLLAAGHHHPWPWPLDAGQLALTLCGMAGQTCDQDDLDRARKLEAELGQPVGPAELAGAAPTYRDLLSARDRVTEQLTASLARIARLETKLSYRERELVRTRAKLRKSQRKAATLRRTLGYRLSRRLSRPRRAARKVLRLLTR
ncbi:hypothetical protein HTZ77_02915 [Nonomuraea sp. SMC257]|uniref:Class I SAM-dependent methyltransferase n=1 Tax=Nonomuraea montanisoli TaxID=2741721 RepID=A0A7Y6I2Q2_9ACTN|nr:hypothetical protein [Nonomuraea montanisoli]NUW30381.1 hypothetical protein [Nonomuraea montanisoli]